jgi:outer membrane lipopolysaccharide assembly protein LptE/RlpB
MQRLTVIASIAPLLLTSCGYHVSGHADLLPTTIKTIAVPAFSNSSNRYRLSDRLAQSVTREFNSRTRYRVVNDPSTADAVLRGSVLNLLSATTTFDSITGRPAGAEINVVLQLNLVERATGKLLYSNPSMMVRERYEISTDPVAYFEESDTALDRVSRDVARAVVSAILEAF